MVGIRLLGCLGLVLGIGSMYDISRSWCFILGAVCRLVDQTQIGMTAYGDIGIGGGKNLVTSRRHAGMNKVESPAQIGWDWWFSDFSWDQVSVYKRKESYSSKQAKKYTI